MKIARKDLLNKMLCIETGISRAESIQQSGCIVLSRGWMYSLSREIACAMPSGLNPAWQCAIKADKITDVLKAIKDEEIDVEMNSKTLSIKGSTEKVRILLEAEILLAFDSVKTPPKEAYKKLPPTFGQAVDLSCRCTRRKVEFAKACVHVHPQWLEASDNERMIRYPIRTFVKDSVLVRGESIKRIAQLGMTVGAETDTWLHFRNPLGLRVSIQKFALEVDFPPLDQIIAIRGKRVTFPKNIADAAQAADLFADDETGITIRAEDGSITIYSQNSDGDYEKVMEGAYSGPKLAFRIPARLITELVSQGTTCEVSDNTIRVDGGTFIYVACLQAA